MKRAVAVLTGLAVLLIASLAGCAALVMRDLAPVAEHPATGLGAQSEAHDELDSSRPYTALFVGGHAGTEVTDLLGPWAVLAESGLFENRLVAATTAPVPVTGRVFAEPDHTFSDAPRADLIVVPAVIDPSEPELLAWLQKRKATDTRFLSVCAGAELAGAAGLLDDKLTTTHSFSLNMLQQRHPSARFAAGYRYVEDGDLISSAGVTSGIDAALYIVEGLAGRQKALDTASRLGIQWHEEDDVRATRVRKGRYDLQAGDYTRILGNAFRRPTRADIGVLLESGTSELALAAVLDAFPRTLRNRVHPVASRRIRSAHGMHLLPPVQAADPDDMDLWIRLPATGDGDATPLPEGAAQLDLSGFAPGQVLAEVLRHIESQHGESTRRYVSRMIETPYP